MKNIKYKLVFSYKDTFGRGLRLKVSRKRDFNYNCNVSFLKLGKVTWGVVTSINYTYLHF